MRDLLTRFVVEQGGHLTASATAAGHVPDRLMASFLPAPAPTNGWDALITIAGLAFGAFVFWLCLRD